MKANEFVKKYGWERSIELVEGCPDHCNFIVSCGYIVHGTAHSACKIELKKYTDAYQEVCSYGGLASARKEAHKDCFEFNRPLLAACYLVASVDA